LRTRFLTIDSKHFITIERLFSAEKEAISALPDIGLAVAESLHGYGQTPEYMEQVERLKAAGLQLSHRESNRLKEEKNTFLQGKRLVISGSFKDFSRQMLSEHLAREGATVVAQVSSKVDFLLVGEKPSPKKMLLAQKYQTKMVDEAKVRARLKGEGQSAKFS